jgi:hypothetical protein
LVLVSTKRTEASQLGFAMMLPTSGVRAGWLPLANRRLHRLSHSLRESFV